MQQNEGYFLYIQSVKLCFLIGELSLLLVRDINDQWLLVPVILLFELVLYVCFSSVVFVERCSCVFRGVVTLFSWIFFVFFCFYLEFSVWLEKDNIKIWFCHGISWLLFRRLLTLLLGTVVWAVIYSLLVSVRHLSRICWLLESLLGSQV